MKKTALCLAVILLLAFLLSSCMNLPVKYKPSNGAEGIASVRIYYVESANGYDAWGDAPDLEELATASAEVPSFRYDKLFSDLKKLNFQNFILLVPIPSDPSFYMYGYILAITYEDGGYEYITPNGIQVYGENAEDFGCSHLSCDTDDWKNFIDKYVPETAWSTSATENTFESTPESTAVTEP
jgi:hypothetical protein